MCSHPHLDMTVENNAMYLYMSVCGEASVFSGLCVT